MSTPNAVTAIAPATPEEARAHFERLLRLETDCWDVSVAVASGAPGFVLLDVRGPRLYAAGHVPRALNLPHGKINERTLAAHPTDTLFVVYCSGPHCNGADRAALRLASLGRRVKKMAGGMQGWIDEGLGLARDDQPDAP